jgi:hypothetical protein
MSNIFHFIEKNRIGWEGWEYEHYINFEHISSVTISRKNSAQNIDICLINGNTFGCAFDSNSPSQKKLLDLLEKGRFDV